MTSKVRQEIEAEELEQDPASVLEGVMDQPEGLDALGGMLREIALRQKAERQAKLQQPTSQ